MLWLMFPSYNERENLISLLPEIDAFLKNRIDEYHALIIDDGSTDSTRNIREDIKTSLPISIISHEKNKGIGKVFQTGFSEILRVAGKDDLLIVLEADGTSDYSLIPAIVEKLKSGHDIVIASRYIPGGAYRNFPFKRHMISLLGNFMLRAAFMNKKTTDYTIFYRGYRIGLLRKAMSEYRNNFITSDSFLANTEVLVNLFPLTKKIHEIPFVYSYDRKKGHSKMPITKTLIDHIRFVLTKGFRRLP